MLRTHLTRLVALEQRTGPVEGPLGLVWLPPNDASDAAAHDVFIAERTAALLAQGYGQVLVIEFVGPEPPAEETPVEAEPAVAAFSVHPEEIPPANSNAPFAITFVESEQQPEPDEASVAPAPAALHRTQYRPDARRGHGGPHSWMR